jgi:Zn-dependent protease with chaperone function
MSWVLIPLCAVPHALGHLAKSVFLRGRFRLAELLHLLLQASPLLLYAAALWIAGWLPLCERWSGVRPGILSWPGPTLFLALMPFLLFSLLAIDARARCGAAERSEVGALRRFQTRMFLSGLAPIAIFVAVASLVDVFPPARIHIEEVSLWGGCFALVLLALMVLAMPVLLANTWETTRLGAGLERAALEAVAARAGFRYRDLMVWNTGNLFANAAIVGVAPRLRYVLFSDALLAQLALPELLAVFGHEIGHARRAHVLIFGAWTAAFFLFADLLSSWVEPLGRGLGSAVVLLVLALWYVTFGYISRRFELEADLESCELIGERGALVRALHQVGGVHLAQRSSWRHFPTAKRIEFLESVERDPRTGAALRMQLRALAWLGIVLFCAVLVFEIRSLAASYDRDRVMVDLRLGRSRRSWSRRSSSWSTSPPAWLQPGKTRGSLRSRPRPEGRWLRGICGAPRATSSSARCADARTSRMCARRWCCSEKAVARRRRSSWSAARANGAS